MSLIADYLLPLYAVLKTLSIAAWGQLRAWVPKMRLFRGYALLNGRLHNFFVSDYFDTCLDFYMCWL
jgi:hypothetical protein